MDHKLHPRETVKNLGDIVYLTCDSNSDVVWTFRDSHEFPSNVMFDVDYASDHYTLTIANFNKRNEGIYRCEGEIINLNNIYAFFAELPLTLMRKKKKGVFRQLRKKSSKRRDGQALNIGPSNRYPPGIPHDFIQPPDFMLGSSKESVDEMEEEPHKKSKPKWWKKRKTANCKRKL